MRFRAPALTTALLLMSALGCTRAADSHVRRGDAFYEERRYREAIDEYDLATRYNPSNARAIRQLGLAHNMLGDRRDAYSFLEKSREIQPNDRDVRLSLGNLYLHDLRRDDAINEADAVLRKNPRDPQGLNILGLAYLGKGDAARAADTFRKLERLTPNTPRVHLLAGNALLNAGNAAGASQEFEAALTTSPTFAEALSAIVQTDVARHETDAALARVRQQISVAGDSPAFRDLLGIVHVERGEGALAKTEFLRAIALDPKYADAYVRLGGLYRSADKLDSAVAMENQALQIDSANIGARMVLGAVYQQLGDVKRAAGEYEAALAVNPRYAGAAKNLARILGELGVQPERALKLALVANQSDPGNPAIYDVLGWLLYKIGDYKRALAALKQSAAKLPDDPAVQYHLGMASQKVRDTAAARQAFQRAISSKLNAPEKTQAQQALIALK